MTIHDFPTPNILTGVTRSLVIDDSESVGFLNGEQEYLFEAVPGHTLVLTLYLEAGLQCSPNLSFGDPPVIYNGCFGYVDFGGDPFVGLSFGSPPGNPLSADSGYQYVPEPASGAEALLADASLLALLGLRRRQ